MGSLAQLGEAGREAYQHLRNKDWEVKLSNEPVAPFMHSSGRVEAREYKYRSPQPIVIAS